MTNPAQPAPAGSSVTPSTGWRRALSRRWFWVLSALVLLSGIGVAVGYGLLVAARQDQVCTAGAQSSSWTGIQISGLPAVLQSSFGYGRGTQVIESTLNATARPGFTLPASIAVFAEPLTTIDGTQIIPSLSVTNGAPAQRGVSAVATRIASTSTYQLEVCVRAPTATAGSYSTQLLFPGATLATGTSLPVNVTFQSQVAPFILTVGLAPLSVLGMLYTTLVLVRVKDPHVVLGGIGNKLLDELWSVNGLAALILSVGAVFTAWNAQCFRNPVWGTPWPTILVSLVTMAGAAAAASSVPMSLSRS